MRVNEITTGDLQVISPNTTVRDAAKAMREADVGARWVGENNRLVGVGSVSPMNRIAPANGQTTQST